MISNLPPGVSEDMIPGNEKEIRAIDKILEIISPEIVDEIESASEIGFLLWDELFEVVKLKKTVKERAEIIEKFFRELK